MALRITASSRLQAGMFRHGPVNVEKTRWSSVDPNDPEVRLVLLGYVGTHITLFPDQGAALAAAELELRGGRLADLRVEREAKAAEMAVATPTAEKKPTKKS